MAPKSLRWAELKLRDDDPYADAGITDWGNKDLYPVLEEEKTFGWFAFLGFMTCSGVCVSNYSLGSSYIAVGLTAAETIGSILAGSFIAGCLTFIAARPGLDHGIGYVRPPVYHCPGHQLMLLLINVDHVLPLRVRLERPVDYGLLPLHCRRCLCVFGRLISIGILMRFLANHVKYDSQVSNATMAAKPSRLCSVP